MASFDYAPPKDPDSVEPYFFVFCSKDGTNTNTAADTGDLKGATISSITSVTVSVGDITVDSSNSDAVTVDGISYGANTVVTAWYSAGTDNTDSTITARIVTSDSRTLDKTMIVPVRSQ